MPARIRVPHRFSQPERGFMRDFPAMFLFELTPNNKTKKVDLNKNATIVKLIN